MRPYRRKWILFVLPAFSLACGVGLFLGYMPIPAVTVLVQGLLWSAVVWVAYRRPPAPAREETRGDRTRRAVLVAVGAAAVATVGGMIVYLLATTPHR